MQSAIEPTSFAIGSAVFTLRIAGIFRPAAIASALQLLHSLPLLHPPLFALLLFPVFVFVIIVWTKRIILFKGVPYEEVFVHILFLKDNVHKH